MVYTIIFCQARSVAPMQTSLNMCASRFSEMLESKVLAKIWTILSNGLAMTTCTAFWVVFFSFTPMVCSAATEEVHALLAGVYDQCQDTPLLFQTLGGSSVTFFWHPSTVLLRVQMYTVDKIFSCTSTGFSFLWRTYTNKDYLICCFHASLSASTSFLSSF